MKAPTLSVVMVNYNHGHYISQALEAVLSQSHQPMEVIVIDDASTDNSAEVIGKIAAEHRIVRLFRNDVNRGAIFSTLKGVEMCEGEYVGFTNSDDRVLPGIYEKYMKLLGQYPQAGLCFSDPAQYLEYNGEILENRFGWSEEPRYFSPKELAEVINGQYISGHTVVVKKSAFIQAGRYNPELKWHCDWFTWLVIAFRSGACYVPEPLAVARILPDSYSGSREKENSTQLEILAYLLYLIKSENYRDVLPYFVRGLVMSHFGTDIVNLVLSSPEHWDLETLMLIQNPLWKWNQESTEQREALHRDFGNSKSEHTIRASIALGESALKHGKLDEAHRIFSRLTNKFPDLADGYSALAEIAVAKGDYVGAVSSASAAVRLAPSNPELYNQLGTAYYAAGDMNSAESAFRQALQLDETNPNAGLSLSELARSRGDLTAAASHLEKALEAHPDNIDLLAADGRIALEAGNRNNAKNAFQCILTLDPSRKDIRDLMETI